MADTTRSVIYYPHTGVRTVELLKSGLLLWDRVEYIAPFDDFEPGLPYHPQEDEETLREAMDLLLVPHVPSEEEKLRAHETIVQFAESDLAERLRYETVNESYLIYPQKFSEETWNALKEAKLANVKLSDPDGDYEMPSAVGLVMMSVLADACAGTLKRTITDQQAAYATVRESIIKNTIRPANIEKNTERLVDVTLRLANLDNLPLKKLVKLRQRENQSLKQLRHAFVSKIDEAAKQMASLPQETDRQEVQRRFESDMETDFEAVCEELGELGWKAVFSREMVIGMLSTAGLLTQPFGQMVAAAAALVGLGVAYRRERRAALEKHAMSWLYVQR